MQRIYIGIFIFFIFGIFFSCMSMQYIKTGEELSPLSNDAEIATFISSQPQQEYQKIGLLRIRGGDLDKRVERAKLYAREKGGDGVIANEIGLITDPGSGSIIEKLGTSTYETQEFLIVKLMSDKTEPPPVIAEIVEEEKDNIEKAQIPAFDESLPPKPDSIDYSALPRATYSQLIKDYKSLEGELFRGSLFPKKIYKIPSSLKANTESGDRLILLTTKSGRSKLYLIINKNLLTDFRSKIISGQELNFVYSPVTVYSTSKTQRPVIKFVEEIND